MKAKFISYKDGKKVGQVLGNIIFENDYFYTADILDKHGKPKGYKESFNKVDITTNELRVVKCN